MPKSFIRLGPEFAIILIIFRLPNEMRGLSHHLPRGVHLQPELVLPVSAIVPGEHQEISGTDDSRASLGSEEKSQGMPNRQCHAKVMGCCLFYTY